MSDPGELAASFLHLAMIEPAGHCVYLNANGVGLIRPAKRMRHDHKKLRRPGHPRSGEPQRSDAAIHAHTCASEDWYPGKDRREGIPGVKLCPRLQGGIDKPTCPCHSITRLNKMKLRSFIPKAPVLHTYLLFSAYVKTSGGVSCWHLEHDLYLPAPSNNTLSR